MKTKVYIALLALGLSVLVHGYLLMRFYPLHFGFATGQSICNVSAKLDCDAVSASPYSTLFGVPMAAFGVVYNGLLFLWILLTWLGLVGSGDSKWRWPLWTAGGSVAASVAMGLISTFGLGSYCLFCVFAYALSLAYFAALWVAQPEPPLPHLKSDFASLWTQSKISFAWMILIPTSATLLHMAMVQNFGADELEKVVISSLADWRNSPVQQWSTPPSLTKGANAETAKMTIVEFADFRCGHCKMAAPSLSAFVKAHTSDVRLLFYTFPLDGACNPAIDRSDGISCELAKATLCAGQQSLGWETHDLIFENQGLFQSLSKTEAVQNELKRLLKPLSADWTKFETCLKDPQTTDLIKAQAQMGIAAKVKGTPSIFVNGRLLERGQVLPVLEGARKALLSSP